MQNAFLSIFYYHLKISSLQKNSIGHRQNRICFDHIDLTFFYLSFVPTLNCLNNLIFFYLLFLYLNLNCIWPWYDLSKKFTNSFYTYIKFFSLILHHYGIIYGCNKFKLITYKYIILYQMLNIIYFSVNMMLKNLNDLNTWRQYSL